RDRVGASYRQVCGGSARGYGIGGERADEWNDVSGRASDCGRRRDTPVVNHFFIQNSSIIETCLMSGISGPASISLWPTPSGRKSSGVLWMSGHRNEGREAANSRTHCRSEERRVGKE